MDPYEMLISEVRQTRLFTEEQLDFVCRHFSHETLNKNACFLEEGQRCSRIGFLTSGILSSYRYSMEGELVVKYFVEPGQFFTDLESYEQEAPARLNIQAVTDAEVLIISRSNNRLLTEGCPPWEQSQALFAAKALNAMIQSQHFLHVGSARDKYRHFVTHHPNLARMVPLKLIASYLGITQSSLSRLRRENL